MNFVDDLSTLSGQTVLVTGAGGMLGRAFLESLDASVPGARVLAYDHAHLDVADAASVMDLASQRPDIIVHCAGPVIAEQCEREPAMTWRAHVTGTANIARLAHEVSARVLYPQSVLIFDGHELPVTERTQPVPLSVYARAKVEAERVLLATAAEPLVVTMAGFFGGDEMDKNFVGLITRTFEEMLADGRTELEVGDRVWQPTYTLDHAHNCLLLLARGRQGRYMMGSLGEATFHDVASACVDILGLGRRIRILASPSKPFDDHERVKRPARMVVSNDRLDAEGLNRQRPWRDALREYLQRPWFDRLRHAC